MGEGKGKKKRGREANHNSLLNAENKLSVAGGELGGGWAKWVMGIKKDTCWDEHWVLYGNQFDNFILKKKKVSQRFLYI